MNLRDGIPLRNLMIPLHNHNIDQATTRPRIRKMDPVEQVNLALHATRALPSFIYVVEAGYLDHVEAELRSQKTIVFEDRVPYPAVAILTIVDSEDQLLAFAVELILADAEIVGGGVTLEAEEGGRGHGAGPELERVGAEVWG